MTEATKVSGYPITIGQIGANTLLLWKYSAVSDANTITTGIASSRLLAFWVNWNGNPGTQGSGGGHATYAAATGVITMYPSTDSLAADVFVLVSGV
jgi:hypothetical protein